MTPASIIRWNGCSILSTSFKSFHGETRDFYVHICIPYLLGKNTILPPHPKTPPSLKGNSVYYLRIFKSWTTLNEIHHGKTVSVEICCCRNRCHRPSKQHRRLASLIANHARATTPPCFQGEPRTSEEIRCMPPRHQTSTTQPSRFL